MRKSVPMRFRIGVSGVLRAAKYVGVVVQNDALAQAIEALEQGDRVAIKANMQRVVTLKEFYHAKWIELKPEGREHFRVYVR